MLAERCGHRALRRGRFDRVEVVGPARVALFLGEIVEQAELVPLEQLHFGFQVRCLQNGEVGVQTVVDVRDRVGERIGGLSGFNLQAAGCRLVEAEHADADLLLAEAAPNPRAPLLQRTAGLDPVVLVVLNRVPGAGALLALIVRDVVRLEPLVGHVHARRAAKLDRPALGDEVDADAAGLLRHVDAAGVDRHFLEGVEVVVAR